MGTDSKEVEHAFQVHLAEYEAVRNEINLHIGLQHQLINYAIAIIAGTLTLLALGQPRLASQYPSIFLVASLLMSAISWALMDASFQINDLGNYIHNTLAPKIQILIGHETLSEYIVLGWEETKVRRSGRLVLKGITATGKFAVAFIPSIVFIMVFYYLRPPQFTPWTLPEAIFFWAAVGTVLILPLGGLINLPFILHTNFKPFWSFRKKKLNEKRDNR